MQHMSPLTAVARELQLDPGTGHLRLTVNALES